MQANSLDDRMKILAQSALDRGLSVWQLLAELDAKTAILQAENARLNEQNWLLCAKINKVEEDNVNLRAALGE
jgi:uncharacterized small protein (DUF1192 family)